MDQARHDRVEELFHHAVEMPPEEQSSYLKKYCQDDPDLLRVLEALLQEDRRGPIRIEHPLTNRPLEHNLSGRMLSHYRITEPVASGGMGTVYKATDIQLERTVALKFLSPSITSSPENQERFLREARAIASIDHPNVCTVYQVEEAEGFTFIAMAYLKGTPLDRKIANGPLTVEEAVEIVIQTARGLEAAHTARIVHRDIKPANLMLMETESGHPLVRILDFGIAHWTEKPGHTQNGLTMGTISYMAPEQIGQSRVDARADIWSLGVVLYQMLSGHLPFDGGAPREILAAIAGPQPVNLTAISGAPAGLVAIVGKMLEKDPHRRYPNVSAVITDLEKLRSGYIDNGITGTRPRPYRTWIIGSAAAIFALGIGLAIFRWIQSSAESEPLRIVPFTFYPGDEKNPAISPDEKQIAFVGQGREGTNPLELYVQLIGTTDPLRLTRSSTGFEDRSPAWDPTGTRISFLRLRKGERFARIMIVPALGGAETDLRIERVLGLGHVAWSPDGHRLAFVGLTHSDRPALFEFSLDDRTIRERSFPAEGQADCCPQYDPSGRWLAFKRNETEIVITGDGNRPLRALPARASWPGLAWSADGRSLLYSWFGQLARVNLSNASIERLGKEFGPNVSDINIRDQHMAYVRWDFEHGIWKLDLRHEKGPGTKIGALSNARLIASTLREDSPQFSPDGQWIAFCSERSGAWDIWIGGRDGSNLRRLTFFEKQIAGTPRWSPDGKSIVFDVRPPSAAADIYVIGVAGGEARRITSVKGGADVPSWSHDGRWIFYHSRSDDQIRKIPATGGDSLPVTRGGGFEGFASADGGSLYYTKSDNVSGIWRLNLATGKEESIPELAQAGQFRHWAVGRSGIFFVANSDATAKDAAVRYFNFTTRKTSRVASVGTLVTAGPGALAISPDETSLLYVRVERDNHDIMLAENFR